MLLSECVLWCKKRSVDLVLLTDSRPNPEIRPGFRWTALQINRREYEARAFPPGRTRASPRSQFIGDSRCPRGWVRKTHTEGSIR
jgi:hypothetical protein